MSSNLSKYLFAFFALFVLFSDEMFYSVVSLMSISLETGMKAKFALGEAIIAYALLMWDFLIKKYTHRNYLQFLALVVIMGLYYITGFFYSPWKDLYWSSFLVYGALCVPATYVGIVLARENYEKEVTKLLPFFVTIISLVVIRSVITSNMEGIILRSSEKEAFNYQTASYFLSFCYSYCFLYVFFYKKNKKSFWGKMTTALMLLLLFVCAVGCLLGGGRGAFVYIVAITAYLIYRVMKRGGKNNTWYVLLIIGGAVLMIYLSDRLNIIESAGFMRMRERMTFEGDNRIGAWLKALDVFVDSPIIGHGLGSIWWTVGFYSHNIFTDLLAEIGLIGTIIIVTVLIKCLSSLIKWSRLDSFDLFMLIIFLGALIHDSFSGYWISSYKFFLIFGYVYAKRGQIYSRVIKKRQIVELKSSVIKQ